MTRTIIIAVFAVALGLGLSVLGLAQETKQLELVGKDLSSWREPHAAWQIVGDVKMGGEMANLGTSEAS